MSSIVPDINSIRRLRDENDSRFRDAIKYTEYDRKGMWYSELFIFSLICEILGCRKLIESGRARGVSTEVLSNYFEKTGLEIVSIDNRPSSADAKVAEKRVSNAPNVQLEYGDSTKIVPELANEETAVLIDGPKGDTALQMAIHLLEEQNAPVVGVHDLSKDTFYRQLSELLFTHCLYTDEDELIESFCNFDDGIRQANKQEYTDGKYESKSNSYGPTLGLFFNNSSPINTRIKKNYYEYYYLDAAELGRRFFKKQVDTGGPVRRKIGRIGLKIGKKLI